MRFSPTRMFVADAGCLWPFRAEVTPPPDPENAKMRHGKEVHKAIELAIIDDKPPVPTGEEDVRWIAAEAFKWAKARWAGPLRVEQAIGIDPATGKAALHKDREAVPQDHVAVIVDVFNAHTGAVYDWKTGSQFSKFDYAPQARLNGYAVASLLGLVTIETGLAYVSETGVAAKSWLLDEFDLADQRQKLRAYAAAAPTAEPVRCSACRYCPARRICPLETAKEVA